MQKYQIIEKIGEGAYGIVLKCRCNDPQSIKRKQITDHKYADIVAMKQFKDSDQNQMVKRTTMRQVKILKMLSHPNIVQLKEAFRKKGFVYLIFQYVRNNLLEVLQRQPDGLDQQLIKMLLYQLLKGLNYLHSLNIIHRDIKPENLLVSQQNQLKICDFGFARVYKKSNKEQLTDYVATRWYRAPELLVGAQYNKQIDMWAVGCILGELIDGNPMFPGQNQLDQLFLIQKCLGPLLPTHHETFLKNPRFIGSKFPQISNLSTIQKRYVGKFTPKGISLLKSLLKMNPSERLTAQQAINHPYFQGVAQQYQILRKYSLATSKRNESKLGQKDQIASSYYQNNKISNQHRKNGSLPYQSSLLYEIQRQKTQASHHNNNINLNISIHHSGGDNNKLQKIINKKSKQDNNYKVVPFVTNNDGSYHNNSFVSEGEVNKSLNKGKMLKKVPFKQNTLRHISYDKKRQFETKTQSGFYIIGDSIIPQRVDQDQQYELGSQQRHSNKIYKINSPKSRKIYRKSTHANTHTQAQINKNSSNFNTQQIAQQQQMIEHSGLSHLPFLIATSHKNNHQSRSQKNNYNIVPNIIIANSTFNYRNGY